MLKERNNTFIVLILKTPNAASLASSGQLLCNTLYKTITKIMTNRLKQIIPDRVSLS